MQLSWCFCIQDVQKDKVFISLSRFIIICSPVRAHTTDEELLQCARYWLVGLALESPRRFRAQLFSLSWFSPLQVDRARSFRLAKLPQVSDEFFLRALCP